jgi:radical SAM-linked protein
MKLLVTYGKVGPTRFASHRDFARAFERGLRRADIPMAYSSGFSPHQRVSYVNPAPTGAESLAEYVVIALRAVCDPATVRTRLAAAMPPGFPVLEVVELPAELGFDASRWEVQLDDADPVVVDAAVARFLAAGEAMVSRETKNGLRTFDARGPVCRLRSAAGTSGAVLTLVIRHTEPLVRPDDVVTALGLPGYPRLKRLAQGRADDLTSS